MGREYSGVQVEKEPNGLVVALNGPSPNKVHVAPKIAEDVDSNEYVVKECTQTNVHEESYHEKQDVLVVKSTNFDTNLPEEKNEKHLVQKLSDYKKSSPNGAKSPGYLRGDCTVPQPFELETEKRGVCTHPVGTETPFVGLNGSPNSNNVHSPSVKKNLQPTSPFSSKKHFQLDCKKHHDEDDNWSPTSSTAASVQTAKFKVTVGVAPIFKVDGRLEKRKEYYTKLEAKHQALEEEKSQCEARTKEEQDEAIKQLRKTLVIKANPVPNFYYEGPPPKVELKKVPLTRPKSPNFTRRKSCGDAVNSYTEKGKVCTRTERHSLGTHKVEHTSPKIKCQTNNGHAANGTCKAKGQLKPDTETSKTAPAKITGRINNRDISVRHKVRKSSWSQGYPNQDYVPLSINDVKSRRSPKKCPRWSGMRL